MRCNALQPADAPADAPAGLSETSQGSQRLLNSTLIRRMVNQMDLDRNMMLLRG